MKQGVFRSTLNHKGHEDFHKGHKGKNDRTGY